MRQTKAKNCSCFHIIPLFRMTPISPMF
jgi:hypothetical protein